MRRCHLRDRHIRARQKAKNHLLLPAGHGVVLPVLEAAASTGGKGVAIRIAAFGRGCHDLMKHGADTLAADRLRLGHNLFARKGCRHEDRVFLGDVIMFVGGAPDTVTTSANMADDQFDRWRIAWQPSGAATAMIGSAAVHDGKILSGRVLEAACEPDDTAENSDLVDPTLIVAVGRVVG